MAVTLVQPRVIFLSAGTLGRAQPPLPSLLRLGTRRRRLPPPLPTHQSALQLLVQMLLGVGGTATACADDGGSARPFSPFHGILQCKIGGEIFPPLQFQPITVPLPQLSPSLSLPFGTLPTTTPAPPVITVQKRKRGGQAIPRPSSARVLGGRTNVQEHEPTQQLGHSTRCSLGVVGPPRPSPVGSLGHVE